MKKICLLTLLLTAIPLVYGQRWEPSPRWEPSTTFGKPKVKPVAPNRTRPTNQVAVGTVLIPAGDGNYVNQANGHVYAPAGPNAVVDTATGQVFPGSYSGGSANNGISRGNPPAINVQTGQVYPGVAGGVINPSNGQFYPDVGPGYINPSNGNFMPKF